MDAFEIICLPQFVQTLKIKLTSDSFLSIFFFFSSLLLALLIMSIGKVLRGIYQLKVNNRNTRTSFYICSKLPPCSSVSILNFEYIIADWMSTVLFCNFSFYAVYMWRFVKLRKSFEEKNYNSLLLQQ